MAIATTIEKIPMTYPCPECGRTGLMLVYVWKNGDVDDCYYECSNEGRCGNVG